jgi:hypothetical protein
VSSELLYAERIAVVGDDRHELVDPPADVGLAPSQRHAAVEDFHHGHRAHSPP